MLESSHDRTSVKALHAYVSGETSEPILISAFRDVPFDERISILDAHRPALEAIDGARLIILESMLLPLDARRC